MKSSSCHQNVAAVWKAQAHGIAVRVKYFGILLQGKRADNFAETKVLSRLCNSLAVLPYDNFVGPWWERTEAAAILLRDFSKFL